ncbi:MAG: hypothetical protein AAGF24_04685 [Cyanobacteria bacterium P01_H01_bin.121]
MNRNSDGFDDHFLEWLSTSPYSPGNVDKDGAPGQGIDLPLSSEQPLLELGEESVIEDRFYAILRQRIKTAIEASPPLFPWESEVTEYQDIPLAVSEPVPVAAAMAWMPQLQSLHLPFTLPGNVATQLLKQCQKLNREVLREGERLVQAVTALFPDTTEILPQIAGQVILGPARFQGTNPWAQMGTNIAERYEQASREQQIFATMLAAQELFNCLQLDLSATTVAKQTWQTEAGPITLTAARLLASQPAVASQWEGFCLVLEAELPTAGALNVPLPGIKLSAEKSAAGFVRCLVPVEPEQSDYAVQIQLSSATEPLELRVHL